MRFMMLMVPNVKEEDWEPTPEAVAAEMEHGGLQRVEVTHQLVDRDRPPRLEVEVTLDPHAQLALDRSALRIECAPGGTARIGSKKQDDLLGHADLDVCTLLRWRP